MAWAPKPRRARKLWSAVADVARRAVVGVLRVLPQTLIKEMVNKHLGLKFDKVSLLL